MHENPVRYELTDEGTYIVHGYNRAKAFSSFLSGIAGVWGIPIWAYYVNRGQGICTFGTQDKDHSILEFESARLHQHRVANEGFRTFLRFDDGRLYEPFRTRTPEGARNRMIVHPHALELLEENPAEGLRIRVRYTTLVNEAFPALLREVTIENCRLDDRPIEIIDGCPRLVTYGMEHQLLKILPFVSEGYLEVLGRDDGIPFIRMKALSSDDWDIQTVDAGNVFAAATGSGTTRRLLTPIVDQEVVFGEYGDFAEPYRFAAEGFDPAGFQGEQCQVCSGFVHHKGILEGSGILRIDSLYGTARTYAQREDIRARLLSETFLPGKFEESALVIDTVRDRCFLHTGSPEMNRYVPQTYLDNVLRGGLPLSLGDPEHPTVFHVFSRKHGDLERDYNMFSLTPTYFSQGNGNFRDVNQNRRHDVWFNPDVGDRNVRWFFNLLQLDGFNPLLCKGTTFRRTADDLPAPLRDTLGDEAADAVCEITATPFDPGSLFMELERRAIDIPDRDALLKAILPLCESSADAEFAQGYWVDHWFYNFDQLDTYAALFPDRMRRLLLEDATFTYYDTHVRVLPRSEKHVRLPDGRVMQVHALDEDGAEKRALLASRPRDAHAVRTAHGRGGVYRCTLLQKILCLLTNKLASLSPSGVGIDMEAGRPGWHDSINGIPGIFGSSTSEIFHLRRVVGFLTDFLDTHVQDDSFTQPIPEEVGVIWDAVAAALRAWAVDDAPQRAFTYWDTTTAAKEAYREATYFGIDGAERHLSLPDIRDMLALAATRLDASLADSLDPDTGLHTTYCRHTPTAWEVLTAENGTPRTNAHGTCVRITAFTMHRLPPFLEAPSHALRTHLPGIDPAAVHAHVRQSPLYDRELGMYIVSESVAGEGSEVGRIWAWAPGWFENENVFLHLEHKYLLGCMTAGLYDACFEDLRTCALPFQDLERYGRNPLENASFIMSSRHTRPHYRGRGFQPRSSGTTAEVLEMVLRMGFGATPFVVEGGDLVLRLAPVLPGWMFTEEAATVTRRLLDGTTRTVEVATGGYAALFLGRTEVVYENPARRATSGGDAVGVVSYRVAYDDGRVVEAGAEGVRGADAEAVRAGHAVRIDCRLG